MEINHNDPRIHAYKVTALAADVCGDVKFRGVVVSKEQAKASNFIGLSPVDICHNLLFSDASSVPTLNERKGLSPTKNDEVVFNKIDRFTALEAASNNDAAPVEKLKLFADTSSSLPQNAPVEPPQERINLLGAPDTLARAVEAPVVETAGETVTAEAPVAESKRRGRRKAADTAAVEATA